MQKCSCIRKDGFLFDSSERDSSSFTYCDLSDWASGDPYPEPTTYEVTIVQPNDRESQVTVNAKGNTIITAEDLGRDCLLDGIYCVKTESCGIKYLRYMGLFPSLTCAIAKILATQEKYNEAGEITNLIESAKTAISDGNINKAKSLYNTAKDIIQSLNCEPCSCK